MRKKVAVLGAGAAGLVAARELQRSGCDVTVFEQADQIGGVWAYTPAQEDDLLGLKPSKRVFSSLYQSLRTNLPRDLMAFPDYGFDGTGGGEDSWPRFPDHSKVLTYLNNFADAFNIRSRIRFNREIVEVRQDSNVDWQVHCADGEVFDADAVAICTGHFSTPRIPALSGIKDFAGDVMHSHNYRTPGAFANKYVVVIGAGASGADIAFEIAGVARQVVLCGNGYAAGQSPVGRVERRPGVIGLEANAVLLADGSRIEEVEQLLFCTGYRYEFPFLSEDIVKVEDNWVHPLYLDIIPPAYPEIGFIGLPFLVVPFPLYALQARWFARSVVGQLRLPDRKAMLRAIEDQVSRLKQAGVPQRHFHKLGDKQADYYNLLAAQCGEPALPEWFSRLVLASQAARMNDPLGFRDQELPAIDQLR